MLRPDRFTYLIHTMEECGELVRACSKVIRHGVYEDSKYIDNLIEEIGDVQAMTSLLVEDLPISHSALERRVKLRLAKYDRNATRETA